MLTHVKVTYKDENGDKRFALVPDNGHPRSEFSRKMGLPRESIISVSEEMYSEDGLSMDDEAVVEGIRSASAALNEKLLKAMRRPDSGVGESLAVRGLLQVLRSEHRTNQQLLGGVMVGVIRHYAKCHDNKDFDARNEAFCGLCAKLAPICKETHMPYI